jgi:TonB-linked SusC/RagA family outer membrane protein
MAGVSPWQPIFDPAGPGGFAKSFGGDPGPYGAETEANHFAIMHFSSNRYDMVRNIGSAYVQVMPIDGLRFKGTLSADFFNNRRRDFNSKERGAFRDIIGNSTYGERHTRNTNLTKEFSINYTKAFGNHSIDLLANAMEQTFTWDGIQGSAQNIFSDDPAFWGIHGVAADRSADTFREQWALQGLMGRVSYNFQSKYYFDATVRQDVSSRFAPEYRKGIFPSIGVAWRISAENFMKGLPFINDLKIRGGWGQLGNQDTRAFAYLSLVNRAVHYPLGNISYSNTEGKTFPGTGAPLVGASIVDFPTRNLTWETSTATNIGLDGALLNNALTFTVEYYNRTTDDILQEVSLPASTGYSSRPVFNVASVNNRGMEFSLGYNGKAGGFTYNVSGNLTTVKNEVLKLNGGTPLGGGDSRIEEGYPINSIYGYQTVGIFQTQEQVNNWLAAYDDPGQEQQKAPGDIQFADLYGEPTAEDLASGGYRSNKPDGKVNDRDQAILGSTIPGHFYGLNLGAGYKGFDLSIFFQGVGDLQRINYFRWGAESMSSNGVNQLRTTLDRWTTANPSTTMPRAIYGDPSGNNRLSNRWVEDAGFLRLKNLQLGYSLPAGVLQKLGGMDQVRIYFGSTNTLTFTRYTGLDPENPGVPPARIFMLGANVTF